MSLRIDFLCNDGSPLGIIPEDIYGEMPDRIGVGGAELALLTLCEQFGKEEYDVRLYNNPRMPSKNLLFSQFPIRAFDPQEDRDVLVIFRSPSKLALEAKGMKVWWSCDPKTLGDYRTFSGTVQKIVGISEFHRQQFASLYGVTNMEVIDVPVRVGDYFEEPFPERDTKKVLFSSIPDRGLMVLRIIWPMVLERVPDAKLVITSDYRLWGAGALNERYRLMFSQVGNVRFLGAVTRRQLVQEEMSAGILAYPSTFEELFCISCAEAMVAGCLPITSTCGALPTTNMYRIFPGDPNNPEWQKTFAAILSEELENPDEAMRKQIQRKAIDRFNPDRIVSLWKEKILK